METVVLFHRSGSTGSDGYGGSYGVGGRVATDLLAGDPDGGSTSRWRMGSWVILRVEDGEVPCSRLEMATI